jgi:hypothetical protein
MFAFATKWGYCICNRNYSGSGIHSGVNKVLIINREINPGRIRVILVDQVLGF